MELTQPGFIDKVAEFEEYLPSNYKEKAPKIPMKAGEQLDDVVGESEAPAESEYCLCDEICGDNDEVGVALALRSMLGSKLSR